MKERDHLFLNSLEGRLVPRPERVEDLSVASGQCFTMLSGASYTVARLPDL
jgi:hypothetical protein